MVRETRYLLVRNLPEKSTEESINLYFQRYGKIQSVKLQPSTDNETTLSATVAFMDIRSASKAKTSKNTIDNALLRCEYWEATPTATSRSQVDSSSRSVVNTGGGGGSSSVGVGFHGTNSANASASRSGSSSTTGFPSSWTKGNGSYRLGSERGGDGSRPSVDGEKERFDRSRTSPEHSTSSSTRNKLSFSVSPSASRSRSRSPRSCSGSTDSHSYSSASSKSCSKSHSQESSQCGGRPQSTIGALKSTLASEIKDPKAEKAKEEAGHDRRPLGICITGLPGRSSDSSLRDGLFHEYKKHGKVTSVQIVNENSDRHAIVSFRKPEDAIKALEASQGKMFFGTKIKVGSHEGVKVEEGDIRTSEIDMDEYHPKATRTLFVGNLEKDTTVQDLLDKFSPFGEVIDVDIKRQGAASAYAFVQYTDIVSVVKALTEMEGKHIGANKMKLGFGKSLPTNCVWIDNLADNLDEKFLFRVFKRYGEITYTFIDRTKNRSLLFFTNLDGSQYAVSEMKNRTLGKKKIMIDFASRECQNNFLDWIEKTGQIRPDERPDERGLHKFRQHVFEYTEPFTEENRTRFVTSSNSQNPASFRGRSGRVRNRNFEEGTFQDDFSPSRRNSRQSSEYNSQSGSFFKNVDDYEQELREYGHSQRERRERGHSPRHVGGEDSHQSFDHPSREVSLDRYDSKDRQLEMYSCTRSNSPCSEHNSYLSDRFVNRAVEDKVYRQKYEKDEDKNQDVGVDGGGRRSPVFVSCGRSSTPGIDDELGSITPPTPTEEEEPIYRTFYPRAKDKDSDFTPTYTVIETKPKLRSVWVNQAALSSSVSASKLGSEVTLPEKSSVRKHCFEDTVSNKESSKKKQENNIGSLTLKLTPFERERQLKLERKLQRRLGKGLNKLGKSDTKARLKGLDGTLSSPSSTGSHAESENGSVSEADLSNLHCKRQVLLEKLSKLEDGPPVIDASVEDELSTTRRVESGTPRSTVVIRDRNDASLEEVRKPLDSKESSRKELEAKAECRLKEKSGDKLISSTPVLDSLRFNSLLLDSFSFNPVTKRRKLDNRDAVLASKHSYDHSKDVEIQAEKVPLHPKDTDHSFSGVGTVLNKRISLDTELNSSSLRSKDSAGKLAQGVCDNGGSSLLDNYSGDRPHTLSGYSGKFKTCPDKSVSKSFLSSCPNLGAHENSSWSPKFGPSPEACFSPTVSEDPPDSNVSESLTEKSSPKAMSPMNDWTKELSDDDDLKALEPGLSSFIDQVQDSLSDDDSEQEKASPGEPSFAERIRMVDEILQSSTLNKPTDASALPNISPLSSASSLSLYSKYRIRKRVDSQSIKGLITERKSEPSVIMQQLLSKPSILDQDFQRLGQRSESNMPVLSVGRSLHTKAALKEMPSVNSLVLPSTQAVGALDSNFNSQLLSPATTAASMHQTTTTTTVALQPFSMVMTPSLQTHPQLPVMNIAPTPQLAVITTSSPGSPPCQSVPHLPSPVAQPGLRSPAASLEKLMMTVSQVTATVSTNRTSLSSSAGDAGFFSFSTSNSSHFMYNDQSRKAVEKSNPSAHLCENKSPRTETACMTDFAKTAQSVLIKSEAERNMDPTAESREFPSPLMLEEVAHSKEDILLENKSATGKELNSEQEQPVVSSKLDSTLATAPSSSSTVNKSRNDTVKTSRSSLHNRVHEQTVRHQDPLFAPDIKLADFAADKIPVETKTEALKEKYCESTNNRADSEGPDKKTTKNISTSSHTDKKISSKSSKDSDRTDKKDHDRKQEHHSGQKTQEKLRQESSSKNRTSAFDGKAKEVEAHAKVKESDNHGRPTKDQSESHVKHKDSDHGRNAKDSESSVKTKDSDHGRNAKDSESSVKTKDLERGKVKDSDSHGKSREKKMDQIGKTKDKDTDAHGKTESKGSDSKVKAKDADSYGKSDLIAKNKDKESDTITKNKDKTVDLVKIKSGENLTKAKDSMSAKNKDGDGGKVKHKEESKKEREHSMDSKSKHHDAHRKERKSSSEKKEDRKLMENNKEEKKVHNKVEEKREEKKEDKKEEKKDERSEDKKTEKKEEKKDERSDDKKNDKKEEKKSERKEEKKESKKVDDQGKPKAEHKHQTSKHAKSRDAHDSKKTSTTTTTTTAKTVENIESKENIVVGQKTGQRVHSKPSKDKEVSSKVSSSSSKDRSKGKSNTSDSKGERDKEKQKEEKPAKEKGKMKSKEKEKKKGSESGSNARKIAEDVDDFPYHLVEEPVFTSMYDTIKRRSCNKTKVVQEVTEDTRKQLTKLKSRRNSSKKSKSSRNFFDDSSSDSEPDTHLSLDSDSSLSDDIISMPRESPEKSGQKKQQVPVKRKRTYVLPSSSDDEDEEEDEEALLRITKSKSKSLQEKKFPQIYDSSSDSEDMDRDSSPEPPPPKMVKKKLDTKLQAKRPKYKSMEESNNESDVADSSSLLPAALSEVSMTEDEMENKDFSKRKKTKSQSKDVPAKKLKLSNDSKEKVDRSLQDKKVSKIKSNEKKDCPKEEDFSKEAKVKELQHQKEDKSDLKKTKKEGTHKTKKKDELEVQKHSQQNLIKKKKKYESKSEISRTSLQDNLTSSQESSKTCLHDKLDKMMTSHDKLASSHDKLAGSHDKLANSYSKLPSSQDNQASSQDRQICSAAGHQAISQDQTSCPEPDSMAKDRLIQTAIPWPEAVETKSRSVDVDKASKNTTTTEKEKKKNFQKEKIKGKDKDNNKPNVAEVPKKETKFEPKQLGASVSSSQERVVDETRQDKDKKKTKGCGMKSKPLEEFAKDAPRQPILQLLAEDMEKQEQKLKEKLENKLVSEMTEEKSADVIDRNKMSRKKKKKKEDKILEQTAVEYDRLDSQTAKESEPLSAEAEEAEDPFVSFWGHPAPVLAKKRDSIPKCENKDKDDQERKSGSIQGDDESNRASWAECPVVESSKEIGHSSCENDSQSHNFKSTLIEGKVKPAWDANVFSFESDVTQPAISNVVSSLEQESVPLINIPEDAFNIDPEEIVDIDVSDRRRDIGERTVKKKVKKKKSERKGSKEIDPLAAVESSLEATKSTIKDETVLLQDVIDNKAVFPGRRFPYEDEIGIPKENCPLFSECRTQMRDHFAECKSSLPKPDQLDSDSNNKNSKLDVNSKTKQGEKSSTSCRQAVVSSDMDSAEKAASTIAEPQQVEVKLVEGDSTLVSQLERDEIAMQEASDEAARAVECLLGFQEDYESNDNNLQIGEAAPAVDVIEREPPIATDVIVEPVSLQSHPDTSETDIPEASEVPEHAPHPESLEESVSFTEHPEPDAGKKGQRNRNKKTNKCRDVKDTCLLQEDVAVLPDVEQQDSTLRDTHLSPFGSDQPIPKTEGNELKKNPVDAYDFDAQMNDDDDESGHLLHVEPAISGSVPEDVLHLMKSPRRKNLLPARGTRGRRGRARDTMEKMGKPDHPPASPGLDSPYSLPAPTASQLTPWQQSIVKDDLTSPESKTDLDSSYGESELVINLDDQGTPTDGEERGLKCHLGSDSEDKSPSQQNNVAVSPYKSQRSTRTRKPTNYKAMDQGINLPSPRASRSAASPRGARGGQSPKNPSTPRGRGSPKSSGDFSTPFVKLEKLEMGRGRRKDEQKTRVGKDGDGIEDIAHTSFEDWKAAKMFSIESKPISKEDIYEFEKSEQEKMEPSPVLRPTRNRIKLSSESHDGGLLSSPVKPPPDVQPTLLQPVQQSSTLPPGLKLEACDDDGMSNVDKIIDAVSKGFFEHRPVEEQPGSSMMTKIGGVLEHIEAGTAEARQKLMTHNMAGKLIADTPLLMATDEVIKPERISRGRGGKIKPQLQPVFSAVDEKPPNFLSGFHSDFPHVGIPADTVAAQSIVSRAEIKQEVPLSVHKLTHSQDMSSSGLHVSAPPVMMDVLRSKNFNTSAEHLVSTTHSQQAPPHTSRALTSKGDSSQLTTQMSLMPQSLAIPSTSANDQGRRSGVFAFPTNNTVSSGSMTNLASIAVSSGSVTGLGSISVSSGSRTGPASVWNASQESHYTSSPKLSSASVIGHSSMITSDAISNQTPSLHPSVAQQSATQHGLTQLVNMPPVPALVQTPTFSHGGPSKSWAGGLLGVGPAPIHTPPPSSQISPTSSMQPQRPQSVQLPVMMDHNTTPLALKRPPSAHSNQAAQHGNNRDRPHRPPSHQGEMRPPSLPGDLIPHELSNKVVPTRDRDREREHLIHLAGLHARQGLPPPPGFVMVHAEPPHSMPPPSPHSQHETIKFASSMPGTVTSGQSGRRGSVQDSVQAKLTPSATLYAGVVAGQPRSLSPKSASPVGQKIERLPNPTHLLESVPAGGASHVHRGPTAHQDPALMARYHTEQVALRAMQPPAAHGENRQSHELLMMQHLLEQRLQQHFLMAQQEAARNAAARAASSHNGPPEFCNSAITQEMVRSVAAEAIRVSAAQETMRTSTATAQEMAALKEVAWTSSTAERTLQDVRQESGPRIPAHNHGPLLATSVQQVPLNLADSESRSTSSEGRSNNSKSSQQPPHHLAPTPGGYLDRSGKSIDRSPQESPRLPSSAFVPPSGSGPSGTHRESLPPQLYGNDISVFQGHSFGMPMTRVPLDPRSMYAGQQPPQFFHGRDPFTPFISSAQRFPLDQQVEADRHLKKGELHPSVPANMPPMGRSPSPIPSQSPPRCGMPVDINTTHSIPVRENLHLVLGRYPTVWQGVLALKNDHSFVQMHFVSGSRHLPEQALPQPLISGAALPLRISQRMRLEPPNLEGVTKRMINEKDYTLLLAVPCGHDHMDISEQTKNLTVGFIEYLRSKLAAGIVNVSHPGSQQPAFVVHVFPPCDFSMEVVARHSTGLVEQIHDLAHVIIIITTV